MDRRNAERTHFFMDANITSGTKVYDGFIESVSRDGMEYLMNSVIESPEHFVPQNAIDLDFQVPAGYKLTLTCEVVWHDKAETYNRGLLLGLKILSPPSTYKKLVEDLNGGC